MWPTAASLIDLALLSPRGIWRPPLSPNQIESALSFGQRHLANLTEFATDPYDLVVPKLKLLVTAATAFSRIAAYAGQCAREGSNPDMAFVENVVFGSSLQDGFMMRIISQHRFVSVIHLDNGTQHNMGNTERGKVGAQWVETCTFLYPTDLASPQTFEAFVPSPFLLWGKKDTFTVDFGALH
jgi:hypothetical protein